MVWIILSIIGIVLIVTASFFGHYLRLNITNNLLSFINFPAEKNISGEQLSIALLAQNEIENVDVAKIDCKNTNICVPKKNVIKLSSLAFDSNSISTLSLSARETIKLIKAKKHMAKFNLYRFWFISCMAFCMIFLPLFLLSAILDVAIGFHTAGTVIGIVAISLFAFAIISAFLMIIIERKISLVTLDELKKIEIFSANEEKIYLRILNSLAFFNTSRILSSSIYFFGFLNLTRPLSSDSEK